MNPYNLAILFFAFCTFFISLLIWLKRHDAIGKSYFIFSLMVTCWGLAASMLLSENASDHLALFCSKSANTFAAFAAVTWFHFTLIFTGQFSRYKKIVLLFYGLAVLIMGFAFTPWFVVSAEGAMGFVHYGRAGILFNVYLGVYFTAVLFGFYQLAKRMQVVTGTEKKTIRGFITATSFGFLGGSLCYFPAYGVMVPQYGLFLLPVYPFIMAYFMIRHRLFDEEELARTFQRERLATIGILTSSMNHEIRNPMYIIKGLTETFLSRLKESGAVDTVTAEDTMTRILHQVQRAVDTTKRFASFAKQKVDRDLKMEALNLEALLEDVVTFIGSELAMDQVGFVRNIPLDLKPIYGDRRLCEEIFFNLIANACQAMSATKLGGSAMLSGEKVGGQIEISAENTSEGVRVTIQDDGPGMPEEVLHNIFQPFYTTREQGTGLGLYITKQLVEKSKGRISVASKEGKGTTFVLEFRSS